jgi:hypothetical protein
VLNPTIDQIIEKAVAIRDKLAAIDEKQKAERKPYEDAKALLENMALKFLNDSHQENAKTEFGTAYIAEPVSAKVIDKDAFFGFVSDNQAFDLLTSAISKDALKEYTDAGQSVPGVEITKIRVARIRRS